MATCRVKLISRFKGEFDFLSNFYTSPFVWKGFCWPTVEHAYQAAKAKFSEDTWTIRTAKTPFSARRLGRAVEIIDNWDEVKIDIMIELVCLKFEYNPTLRDKLLATFPAKLKEGNYHHDNFYGSCSCQDCLLEVGKNMLGTILMEVREDIRQASFQDQTTMTKEQRLREAVFLYIEAVKKWTKCKGYHFRQVCHQCPKYANCLIYSGYIQAWTYLQDSYYVEPEEADDLCGR